MILRLLVTQGIISKVFPEKADNFVRDTSDGERKREREREVKRRRKRRNERRRKKETREHYRTSGSGYGGFPAWKSQLAAEIRNQRLYTLGI